MKRICPRLNFGSDQPWNEHANMIGKIIILNFFLTGWIAKIFQSTVLQSTLCVLLYFFSVTRSLVKALKIIGISIRLETELPRKIRIRRATLPTTTSSKPKPKPKQRSTRIQTFKDTTSNPSSKIHYIITIPLYFVMFCPWLKR